MRLAVLRAETAARGYLAGTWANVVEAAAACGSNAVYVRAVLTLIRAEAGDQLQEALRGHISLLAAAKKFAVVAELVGAARRASAADLQLAGRTLGPALIWDAMVAPNV